MTFQIDYDLNNYLTDYDNRKINEYLMRLFLKCLEK